MSKSECVHGLDTRLPCGDCQKAYEAENWPSMEVKRGNRSLAARMEAAHKATDNSKLVFGPNTGGES